jgi:membrane protein implicated in regulation of membrane protease activity
MSTKKIVLFILSQFSLMAEAFMSAGIAFFVISLLIFSLDGFLIHSVVFSILLFLLGMLSRIFSERVIQHLEKR